MEIKVQFHITPGVSDVVSIARYLSRDLTAQEKSDAVSSLKVYLLDNSYGSESYRMAWLKSIFCEAPLLDADLDADKAITLYTLLFTKLYPDIAEYFSQDVRIAFLENAALVICQLRESMTLTQHKSNKLYRLQAMTLSRIGRDLTYTTLHEVAMGKLITASEIMEQLVAEEPDNAGFQRTLSNIYENLGQLEKEVSTAAAFNWFEKSAIIRTQLLESEPENPFYMDRLAMSYCMLGDVDVFARKNEQGYNVNNWYFKAYRLCRRVIAIQSEGDNYQFSLSLACERLGDMQLQHDKPEKALRWFNKSYSIGKRQYEENRNSRAKLDSYWVACNCLGRAHSVLRNAETARTCFFKALELAGKLYSFDRSNIRYCGIRAMAFLRLAEELEDRYPETANKYYFHSLEHTDSRIREGLQSIDYCKMAIEALEGLERTSKGRAMSGSAANWNSRQTELRKLLDQIS